MIRIQLIALVSVLFTICQSEVLLVNSREIYPNNYAYIIQTEKDSLSLKNPAYAINTNNYAGIKKDLWINVAGFGNSTGDLSQYKSKYPEGYIRKLGQYRNVSTIDRDSVPDIKAEWVVESNGCLISDTQFVSKNSLLHIIRFMSLKGKLISSDTFSISTESEVSQIYTTVFKSRSYPVVVERSFYSGAVGATSEIRIFTQAGTKACAVEGFTNEGGPEEPRNELQFDPKNDQPVIQELTNNTVTSKKNLSCKKQ